MREVRYGIVGCGSMGMNHVKWVQDLKRSKLVAVADSFSDNVKKATDAYDVEGFDDAEAMLDSGKIDAVMIATPHYFHPPLATAAFERGIHVMTEKPVAVTAKAAQEMNDAARKSGCKYGVMYQFRSYDLWNTVKQYIDDGKLGKIQRFSWLVTDWYRTQNYYDGGGWRATWAGEGGGVLLNQCPHNLDLVCWLLGQPSLVDARISLGKYHDIEVEDEVNAYLKWPGGATGSFITSTGEWPGANRFEIVGDEGGIVVEGKRPTGFAYTSIAEPVLAYTRNTEQRMRGPEHTTEQVETGSEGHHLVLHQNFIDAILDDTPLMSPGEEGLLSVELINAMIMSGIEDKPIELPMDRDAYETLLAKLIEDAKQKA